MMRTVLLAITLAIFFGPPAYAAPAVKMSNSGICHTTSSAWYGRTKNFTAFDTLADCVARGGRPPKGWSGPAPIKSQEGSSTTSQAYDRDRHFGSWIDEDGDCFNTRHELLGELSTGPVRISGCRVIHGRWNDSYTGRIFTESRLVDVDHMVPLKWAWDHGADSWSRDQRVDFANDPVNLFVVELSVNRQKGASGPLDWLPPSESYRCEYVLRFKRIMLTYRLKMPSRERDELDQLQARLCG